MKVRTRERKVLEERRNALEVLKRQCEERGVESTPLLMIFKELNRIDSEDLPRNIPRLISLQQLKRRLPTKKFTDPLLLGLQKNSWTISPHSI
jgi:hypothetical protein